MVKAGDDRMDAEVERSRAKLEERIYTYEKAKRFHWLGWFCIVLGSFGIALTLTRPYTMLTVLGVLLLVMGGSVILIAWYGEVDLPRLHRKLDELGQASSSVHNEAPRSTGTIEPGTRFCKYCGQQISLDGAFCEGCGKRLT